MGNVDHGWQERAPKLHLPPLDKQKRTTMDEQTHKKLEAAGWRVAGAAEFVGLSADEALDMAGRARRWARAWKKQAINERAVSVMWEDALLSLWETSECFCNSEWTLPPADRCSHCHVKALLETT